MEQLTVQSPIGPLTLYAEAGALVRLSFSEDRAAESASPLLQEAQRQLAEYFAGTRRRFDLPLRPAGTPFRQQVWAALDAIPYGETCTYAQLAAAIGRPGAARAVGMANHCNPLPILIPCHRCIGADGSLVGYAGGLAVKAALLRLERRAFL